MSYPYGPPSGPQPAQPHGGYGAGAPGGAPPMPHNNLGWGIASMMLCWPFGIPSVLKANKVITLWGQGLYPQAEEAAHEAKKWGKIGVILGVSGFALFILIYILMFVFIFSVAGTVSTY